LSALENDMDRMAAEFVMGLTEGDEAERAERLVANDSRFAAAVERWRRRFADLDATAPSRPASAALWNRIEEALDAGPIVSQKDAPIPRTDMRPVLVNRRNTAPRPTPLRQSLPFWRAVGLVGIAASLLLAVAVAVMAAHAARTPALVAVLLTDANRPAAIVNTFRNGRVELVSLDSIDVPAGRVLEVWTLWDKAVGPRSVGLLERARSTSLDLRDFPRGPNQLFEITLEPAGGSPTGRPTGPILMKGTTSTAL
jgi:anti-sigma-K factor RskA